MSASLVGSEMCIRDSSWIAAARKRPPPLRSCSATTRTARIAPSRSGGPVSYTHLTLPTICSV
eukprot:1923615-Alexandrium_andersonii.AAC.1